jgi:hypothetical protein
VLKRICIFFTLLILVLAATACSKSSVEVVEINLAPIHEVDVRFMESFPVQVGVYIKLGLSDGCTTFRDAVVRQEGNTIKIEVTAQRPKDKICTAVYTFFEKNLNIGSDFIPGNTYTLEVNDYTTSFQIPRYPPQP